MAYYRTGGGSSGGVSCLTCLRSTSAYYLCDGTYTSGGAVSGTFTFSLGTVKPTYSGSGSSAKTTFTFSLNKQYKITVVGGNGTASFAKIKQTATGQNLSIDVTTSGAQWAAYSFIFE